MQNLYFKVTHLSNTKDLFDTVLKNLQPGQERGEVVTDLATQCADLRKQIIAFISNKGTGCPENVLQNLMTMNDSLGSSLDTYQRILNGEKN